MNRTSTLARLASIALAGLAAGTVSSVQAQSATATISGVPSGSDYDYTILLHNSGTLNLNSFWYGWIQFQNDLPSDPLSAANSLGWANNLDGNSIEYVNSTGSALTPGETATFTFVSPDSPTAITSGISGESVAYVGGIDFSQNSPGDSTGIFSPTLVPEPSVMGLLTAGMFAVVGVWRRTRK